MRCFVIIDLFYCTIQPLFAFDRFNKYYLEREQISISDFLRWSDYYADSCNIENPFQEIPVQIIDNRCLMNMFISTQSDTIFFKMERIEYRNFRLINITDEGKRFQSKMFFQLLVWNAKELVYVDDQGNDLISLAETTPEDLRNQYSDFFELIGNWNYEEMNYHKTDYIEAPMTYVAPSEIYRVIFKDGNIEIDKF